MGLFGKKKNKSEVSSENNGTDKFAPVTLGKKKPVKAPAISQPSEEAFDQNEIEDFDYNEIRREMYAPKFPEVEHPWMARYQIQFPPESIFQDAEYARPNAWFNVEVASMMIATHIPSECESCSGNDDVELKCSACGRGPDNYTTVMTANADGDYLGWDLYSDYDLRSRSLTDGFFVSFDNSVEFKFDGIKLDLESQDLAPILVAEFEVNPYIHDIGMIYFADAFATLNSNDFISGIKVPTGKYSVIAWIGYSMTGDLTPMAVTVLGERFMSGLEFEVASKSEAPQDIVKCLTNSLNDTVMARFGADLMGLAADNSGFYRGLGTFEENMGESWAIQFMLNSKLDEYTQLESDALNSKSDSVFLVESLRIRGQQKQAMEFLQKVKTRYRDDIEGDESFRLIIENFEKFPPGSHVITIMSDNEDYVPSNAEVLNNQGYAAYADGNKIEGMRLLHEAAMLGQPNALASYTWFALKDGLHQDAINLYDSSFSEVSKSRDKYMVLNCSGNYALNLAALGRFDEAIKVSQNSLNTELFDIHFFLAMMLLEKNDRQGASEAFNLIPKSGRPKIKEMLRQESLYGGWFGQWCQNGLVIFDQLVKG